MLSIVIPSYKDPLLNRTVESLLENAEGEIEVICVMDGYWQAPIDDPRVRVVHLGGNRGMRGAINAGVKIARGEYLMRMDEHQIVAKGYDTALIASSKPNWIQTPLRYFLDTEKWEIMNEIEPVGIMKLVIGGNPPKFAGVPWRSRDKELENEKVVETMAMQGSCWFMPHKWWDDVIGELQTEGYGPLIQDSHEMVFKTWKAGGKLMVNKNTWHAHKHRKFNRTHNNGTKENPANCDDGYKYAIETWGEYYKEIKKQWKI